MTLRLKFFFISLVLLAIFSVFSFFDILGGVKSANIHEGIAPLLPISEDADQDGLSNGDESIWDTDMNNPDSDGDGFLDGEEVASGRDPRVPAGDDSLKDTVFGSIEDKPIEEINVTDITSGLLAGAIGDGALSRDVDPAKKDESIDYLSLSALQAYYGSKPPAIPTLSIVADTKETEIEYLNNLALIIKDNLIDFPQKLNMTASFNNQTAYFSAKSGQFKSSYEKASVLNIPSDWAEVHKNVLSLLSRLSSTYNSIANYEADMMKAVIALNDINNLNLEIKALTKSVQTEISSKNITLDTDVFMILELLLKD